MARWNPTIEGTLLVLPPQVRGGVAQYIDVGSAEWFEFLDQGRTFRVPAHNVTIRSETRSGSRYWYAFQKKNKRLTKVYVGKSKDFTPERLKKVISDFYMKAALGQLRGYLSGDL